MPYFFAIIGVVIICNFFMFSSRRKKSRNVYQKVKNERIASERNLDNLKLRLNHEQLDLAKRVELQNRMFELFAQVRESGRNASDTETQETGESAE